MVRLANVLGKSPVLNELEVLLHGSLLGSSLLFSLLFSELLGFFFSLLSLLLLSYPLLFISDGLSFEISSPFGNLWLFVDTNGISVRGKDFLELWVVEDLLSG